MDRGKLIAKGPVKYKNGKPVVFRNGGGAIKITFTTNLETGESVGIAKKIKKSYGKNNLEK